MKRRGEGGRAIIGCLRHGPALNFTSSFERFVAFPARQAMDPGLTSPLRRPLSSSFKFELLPENDFFMSDSFAALTRKRGGPIPHGSARARPVETWLNKQFGSKLVAKSAFWAGFSGFAGL